MVKLNESTVYIRTKCNVDQVKKLNLCLNRVENLESLQHCSKLEELYLRKNNVQSLDELKYLQDLKNLRVLWIDENPCTLVGEYRAKVFKMLPQLVKLDDKHCSILDENDKGSNASSDVTLYNNPYCGSAIVDTVMQPQMLQYSNASDEEKLESKKNWANEHRSNLMAQSTYGALPEDTEWSDFSVEEEPPLPVSSRMWTSMHEALFAEPRRQTRNFERNNYHRSISAVAPRRRAIPRTNSSSPARQLRVAKIMSAVNVLLDELDADGLREVVEEAQNRMKKRR
ncbi:hypothetical protein WR25_18989 [Diploscapter pachys]|uniref:U2A'/phosphoprotein 32 family A C-terminal domain-containing protein n=1 Tax=Diploscapter pachys TaxID=2018661 RepID=A0A2A2M091_9BILA|nr:hypothetical protein WR25_18989 [Diploscapter pachys]